MRGSDLARTRREVGGRHNWHSADNLAQAVKPASGDLTASATVAVVKTVDGGYDGGYAATPCFWGQVPGSLILDLASRVDLRGLRVVDLGAGEGKNSAWLAERGCVVEAVEVSAYAIANGNRIFEDHKFLWRHMDARSAQYESRSVDVAVAYGLMHCLNSSAEIAGLIQRMQSWTRPGGWNVLVSFNSRSQDLERAHPGFTPTLLTHTWYRDQYGTWDVVVESDTDLFETHPDLNIEHHHSMTRILARKPL